MTSPFDQQAWLDFVGGMIELGVNWLIQSSLLIIVGLLIGQLLRVRGSAVQSAVYRTTIVAALVCPLVAWALAWAGVSGWSFAMPAAYSMQPVAAGGPPAVETHVATGGAPVDPPVEHSVPVATGEPPVVASDAIEFAVPPVDASAAPVIEQPAIEAPAISAATGELPVATVWQLQMRWFGAVAIALGAVWLAVSFALLSRLALTWWRLARLRRRACRADEPTLAMCRQLATAMQITPPEVLHSPFLPSPCLAGLRNPAVLLPESEIKLPLRDVLIHELAHLIRRDCHWNLLRRLATAGFFFQPLLWALSRRIEATAEEVCDDYVVTLGGDRRDYAHRLVDLAELSTAPMAAGVGIISLRSMLAQRVARIMDSSRSLSTRVGHALLAAVLIGGLLATLLAGLVGVGPRTTVAENEAAAAQNERAQDVPDEVESEPDEEVITVRGWVNDPNGIPFAGATVAVGGSWWEDGKVVCRSVVSTDTDASGRFTLSYRKSQFDADARRAAVTIVATAKGFGPAWVSTKDLEPGAEPALQLVHDDIPIRGRVVDLEGQPVVEAIVKIGGLAAGREGDLTPWLDAIGRGELMWQAANTYLASLLPYELTGLPTEVKTDADGRFRITGIGRERRLQFVLEHASTALTEGTAITRRTDAIIANTGVDDPEWVRKAIVHGAEFELAVPPTQPIVGIVSDAETGEPLAGVEVHSYRMSERGLSAGKDIRVSSDEQGRYRLVGMPKGTGRQIIAVPNADQPYLMREFDVPDKLGLDAIELDLELHRGIWITGRVTDKQTDKPVGDPAQVWLYYIPFRDNPFAQHLPEYGVDDNAQGYQDRYKAAADGSYRMVGLPGRAIVGLTCWNKPYLFGMGSESIAGIAENGKFPTYQAPLQAGRKWPHVMKEVNIPQGAQEISLDFELDPGRSLRLTTIDANERELAGVSVIGMEGRDGNRRTTDAATFDALAFGPDERRTMLLHHKHRNLGQVIRAQADDSPSVVTLQPCATIRGRVLDDKDHPVVGARIRLYVLPGGDFEPELETVATDEGGRFEHTSVLPGAQYNVLLESSQLGFKEVAEGIDVTPGETIDLGTIDITVDERPEPARMKANAEPAQPVEAGSDAKVETVRGRVVDSDGNAVPNAQVVATQSRWIDSHYMNTEHRTVANAKSGADGTFEIAVPKVEAADYRKDRLASFGWKPPAVMASADGRLSTWVGGGEMPVEGKDPFAGEVTLRLDDKSPTIRGRLVNLEGQPLAGLNVKVNMLAVAEPGKVDAWLANVERLRKEGKLPRPDIGTLSVFSSAMVMDGPDPAMKERQSAYFPMLTRLMSGHSMFPAVVKTDEQGQFEITGLPPDCLAMLEISGPGVMTHSASVVTRDIERIDVPQPGTQSNGYYGVNFDYPVAPGTAIVGSVTDEETGQPLEGVRLAAMSLVNGMVNRSQMTSVTDAEGRFRIDGLQVNAENRLNIEPPRDQPYLPADYVEVPASEGTEPVEMPIKLRRGVLVRGKVTDQETGEPVDATIHYHPLLTNKLAEDYGYDPNRISYDEGVRSRTSADGSFQTVVIPGQGILGVQTVARGEHCVGLGAENIELTEDRRFATYNWAAPQLLNSVVAVDVPADAETVEHDLTVTRGVSQSVRVFDSQGQPLAGVRASGTLPQGFPSDEGAESELIEFKAMRPGESRRSLLLHKERKLGAIANVTAPEVGNKAEPIAVQLQPCGVVIGRVVDGEGAPVVGLQFAARVQPPRDFDVATPQQVTTDEEGKFEFDLLPGGAIYVIGGHNQQIGYVEVAKELELAPGEIVDLGTIDVTSKERPEPVRTQAADFVVNSPALAQTDTVNRDDADTMVEYAGKVVTPDGKPASQARVFLVYHIASADEPLEPTGKPIATTDANGEFRASLKASDIPGNRREWSAANIVATADGFGFAQGMAAMYETSGQFLAEYRERAKDAPPQFRESIERTLAEAGQPLRLTPDEVPIRGRIMDINGQPVADAKLTLLTIYAGEKDLAPWLAATKAERADYYSARNATPQMMNGPQVRSLVTPAVTDTDGRFTLRGIGRERIAELLVTGPNLQSEKIFSRTQTGETIELLQEWRSPDLGKYTYYPAEFTYIAGPSRPIVGVVRDRETQQPLAGVTIKSQHRHGHAISGWGQDFVRTTTDAEGRYRLEGMPIGEENRIAAIAGVDQAYLPMSESADTSADQNELEINFDLPPAVWVEGTVTDKSTGEGLPGWVSYYIYPDNPSLSEIGQPGSVDLRDRYQANEQGRFRIPVLPGGGAIGFTAFDHQKYPRATGVTRSDGATRADGQEMMIKAEPSYLTPSNYHIVAEINPAADAESIELKLKLDSGGTVQGRVVDPDGNPVIGFYYCGRLAKFATWEVTRGEKLEVVGYQPDQPRPIYVVHPDRKLAGSYVLKGAPPKDLTIKLQPAGKVTGRVVGEGDEPLGNLMLIAWNPANRIVSSPAAAMAASGETTAPLPPNAQNQSQWITDAEGHFAIDGLIPGIEYRVKVTDRESMSRRLPLARMPRVDGGLERGIVVEPGESLDLGDVRVIDDATFEAQARGSQRKNDSSPNPAPEVRGGETRINGRVTGPDGQPLAGADVAIVGMTHNVARGGDFDSHRSETSAETKTDDDGRFQFVVNENWQKSHRFITAIASADGTAVGWKQLSLDEPSEEVALALKPEEVIKGRLIDIEGQPAAGVKMTVRSVMARALPLVPFPTDGVGYRNPSSAPAAWPAEIVTDAEGRFSIHHVGRNQGVMLDAEGSDRFAPQEIELNTGQSEQRGERDATYRSLVKNVKPGEEAVLPLAPALVFEGTVRYEDTSEPAPNARLTIWASQQQQGGSMISVAGKADAEGRYRINPKPGVRFGVTAYAPEGAPYLTRKLPEVRREGGETTKTVDVTLPRGVMVRGKVVNGASGVPVPKATVQYVPESINNKYDRDDILTGWQGIQLSNDQGEFEIVVLPGPGRLLAHGTQGEFVLQEIAGRQLSHGKPGGWRNYAHGIERIEPVPGDNAIDVTIGLMPGTKISGHVVDEDGNLANGAMLISRLNVHPTTLWWRGSGEVPVLARGGNFELSGLAPGQEYDVYFLDAKRRLGATATLEADGNSPTVVLKPCGEAVVKYVDGDGQALAGHRPSIEMVVTPGAYRYDSSKYAERGELAADADYVSNIDNINYIDWPVADAEGRVTFPALVPGAMYRVIGPGENGVAVAREFTAEAGKKLDLGEIVIDEDGKTAAAKKPEKPAAKPPATADLRQAAANVLSGHVVGHDGKPVAGAEVHWLSWNMRTASPPQLVATTDENGLFKFTAPAPPPVHDQATANLGNQLLVIKAVGHGLALVRPHQLKQAAKPTSWLGQIASGFSRSASSHQAVTLPAPDVPLRGRLVNIDGQPIPGAKVRVREISSSLEQYRARDPQASTGENSEWQQRLMDMLQHFAPPQLPLVAPSATTDADGRFVLDGIGRDQVVELLVEGDRIESTLVLARTEAGEDITISPDGNYLLQPAVIHGAEFTQVVGPSKPLVGKVVDLDSGEPIAGAIVRTYAIHGQPVSTSRDRQYLATASDAEGNYRITGLPIGDENKLVAFATGDEPYVPSGHAADTSSAGEEIEHDFRLKRGVWAEGRVFDAKTKEPLTGQLTYYIFRDAELEKAVPGLRDAYVDELYFTNANGEFRVPVLAARGVLAFFYSGPKDVTAYPRGAGAELIEGAEQEQGPSRMYATLPHYLLADNYWKVVEIHPAADQKVVRADMPLSSGTTVEVRAVSATGVAVPDIDVFAAQFGWAQNRPSQFEVVGLQPDENRKVFVWQPLAKLAGGTSVNATRKEPAVVTMQPSGSVRGRLVDEEGQPISDATVEPGWGLSQTDPKSAVWPYQPGRVQNPDGVPVDKDGRFQIVGLAPGWRYTGRISSQRMMRGRMTEMVVGNAFEDIAVESGEEKDLGDIVVKQQQ